MRKTTRVWAKFNSVGYPDSGEIHNGDVAEIVRKLALWMLNVKMGSRLDIIIARSESELVTGTPKASDEMISMLESIMAHGDGLNDLDEVPEPLLQCPACHGVENARHSAGCTNGRLLTMGDS